MYFSPGPLWDTAYAICSWSVLCFTNVNSLTTNAARSPCRAKPPCPGSDSVQLGSLYPPLPKSKFISQGSHPALYPTYPPALLHLGAVSGCEIQRLSHTCSRLIWPHRGLQKDWTTRLPSAHFSCLLITCFCVFSKTLTPLSSLVSNAVETVCDYLPRFPGF